MALRWDVTACERSVLMPYAGTELKVDDWPAEWLNAAQITQDLVFVTMMIDIGDWTAEDIDEVLWRIRHLEKIEGYLMGGPDGPCEIPEAEIRARVGMRTNVSYVRRNQWLTNRWGSKSA